MARLDMHDDTVVLRLNPAEKVASLRGDLVLDRADIESVEVVEHARRRVHGVRLGTGVPFLVVAGTFGGDGDGETVAVCYLNRPGVVLTLRGTSPRRVVVTCQDPSAVADQLRARTR